MEVVKVRLSEIKPYDKNPRKNAKAVGPVAKSIKEFGFQVPIVLDKDGVIVCGHTRYLAAKRLKMAAVPCVYADDLSPDQVRKFRIADNQTGEMADWDIDKLMVEIDSIETIDMADFGFDLNELYKDDEDSDGEGSGSSMDSDDDGEEGGPEKKGAVKRGQVYQLGEHRLMCGDSTDEDDVAKLMDGRRGEILFTSPPYSDIREYEGGKDLAVDKLAGFIAAYRPYTDCQCINLGIQIKDKKVRPYWNGYLDAAEQAGYELTGWNVWHKPYGSSIVWEQTFFPLHHEWIFIVECGGEGKHELMPAVLNVHVESGKHEFDHPAIFPVDLPQAYIEAATEIGDIIIEPFCGSGTTIIAAERTGRICYGMELDPGYVKLIIDRWESETGRRAELVEE